MKVAKADFLDGSVIPVVLKFFIPHEEDFLVGRYVDQVNSFHAFSIHLINLFWSFLIN